MSESREQKTKCQTRAQKAGEIPESSMRAEPKVKVEWAVVSEGLGRLEGADPQRIPTVAHTVATCVGELLQARWGAQPTHPHSGSLATVGSDLKEQGARPGEIGH